MDIADAQRDLRRAYVGGGIGAIVSGLVWFATAASETSLGTNDAFKVLFVGGMLIFPVTTLLCRLLGRAKESGDNPLGFVALESTVAMIGGLLAAWLFLPHVPAYALPLAAVAVGTHYAVFKTVYGDRTFWLLAAAITMVGVAAIFDLARLPLSLAATVGVIEVLFGGLIVARDWRSPSPATEQVHQASE